MKSRLSTAYPPHIHRFSFPEFPLCGGNAAGMRWISGGCAEMSKRQDLKYRFEITEKQQVNPKCRESRKRQGSRAYLIAGKAKPHQSCSRWSVTTALYCYPRREGAGPHGVPRIS